MSDVVILHNPRCSKSRATLALLESRGITARVVDYIATPPSVAELKSIVALLGIEPRALVRREEPEYAALGLGDPGIGNERLIAAMHAHPRLIQRPIVLANGRAALGRPAENVLAIL